MRPKSTPAGHLSPADWEQLFAAVDSAVAKDPNHPLLVGKPEGNPVMTRAPWDPNPDRWEQGVTTVGGTRWEAGIQNPRQDFKSAALASNDAWKAGVNAAVQGDRFAKGMGAADVDEAIRTALARGGAQYSAGAVARKAKFTRKTEAIKARMGAVVQRVRGMPNATLQQRVQRAVEQINGAAAVGAGAATGGR